MILRKQKNKRKNFLTFKAMLLHFKKLYLEELNKVSARQLATVNLYREYFADLLHEKVVEIGRTKGLDLSGTCKIKFIHITDADGIFDPKYKLDLSSLDSVPKDIVKEAVDKAIRESLHVTYIENKSPNSDYDSHIEPV